MSGGRFVAASSHGSRPSFGRGTSYESVKREPIYYMVNNGKTEMRIIQGDITRTKVDAIVNAANEHMTGGSGVDGIIHNAAGPSLRDECYRHREVERGVRLPTGRSRILLSYDLKKYTHYIINTAGPIYDSYRKKKCEADLTSCYQTAMALANLYDLESIAFPAISCGIFGYPADKGAETAMRTVDKYSENLKTVIFVLFDDHIYDAWAQKAKELNSELWMDDKKSSSAETQPSEDARTGDSSTTSSSGATNDQGSTPGTIRQSDQHVPSSRDPTSDNAPSSPTDQTLSTSNSTQHHRDSSPPNPRAHDSDGVTTNATDTDSGGNTNNTSTS